MPFEAHKVGCRHVSLTFRLPSYSIIAYSYINATKISRTRIFVYMMTLFSISYISQTNFIFKLLT